MKNVSKFTRKKLYAAVAIIATIVLVSAFSLRKYNPLCDNSNNAIFCAKVLAETIISDGRYLIFYENGNGNLACALYRKTLVGTDYLLVSSELSADPSNDVPHILYTSYTFNHNPYWMAWGVIDDSITEVTISNQHCNIIVAKNAKIFYCIDQPGSIPATDNYKLYRHRNSSSVRPGHGVIVPELLNT